MRVIHKLNLGIIANAPAFAALAAIFAIAQANSSFAQPSEAPLAERRAAAVQASLSVQQQAIYNLQQQLIPLLRRGETDAEARERAAVLEKEIARRTEQLAKAAAEGHPNDLFADNPFESVIQPLDPSTPSDAQSHRGMAAREAELAKAVEQLAQRERQVAQLSEQLARVERNQASLPIEGTETKVFSLRHVQAPDASGTLESLFGSHLRVAIDERSNSLIVIGKADTLSAVEALLMRLDQSEEVAEGDEATSAQTASAPKSLLLRVFWLADGLPGKEGQNPGDFLPPAVIDATTRLGLDGPRLVTQTVNSLAVGDAAEVEFATQVPAMLLGQHVTLQCRGKMRPMNGDRTGLNMDIHVQGPSIACELKGSLATPLGHYMVLGTANSVIADPATMAGGGMMMGRGGMGMEMMEGGGVPGGVPAGGFEGGPGGFEAAADPTLPGMEGAMAGEGMGQPALPKLNTSRFAFVVQVIEGESYAAEE